MRRYTLEEQEAVSDLRFWGLWKGIQYAAEGYSPVNTIARIMHRGPSRAPSVGHKILCVDMPARAWQINGRVFALNREHIEVLVARFCLPCKPDGGVYEAREVAPLLGVSERLYRHRLSAAKRAYKDKLFEPLAFETGQRYGNVNMT